MKTDSSKLVDQIAVVVLTCDKYSDLWPPFFDSLFKFWADCPFQIYLTTNELEYAHPKVKCLKSGPDSSWGRSIGKSIRQLDQERVFFLLDDAFFTAAPSTEALLTVFAEALELDAAYLRTRPSPPPDGPITNGIGSLSASSPYRTSMFASLWKRQIFLELLDENESAWAFETEGSARSSSVDGFYCTKDDLLSYVHGVEKGWWIPSALKELSKIGIQIDVSARPSMGLGRRMFRTVNYAKSALLQYFPPRARAQLVITAHRIYKFFGLR